MTHVIELLMKWQKAASWREWSMWSCTPDESVMIEVVEGTQHRRSSVSQELIDTAQIDVLQMTAAEMIERLAWDIAQVRGDKADKARLVP